MTAAAADIKRVFVPLPGDMQAAVREVLTGHQRLVGIGSGRSGADPFVIALARVHNGVVVTEETPQRKPVQVEGLAAVGTTTPRRHSGHASS